MKAALSLLCLLIVLSSGSVVGRDADPDDKLVDYRKSGAWEIWCIHRAVSDQVVCDMNIVLNYQPHPDFRAVIPRVYLDQAGKPWLRLELEWQTSVANGFIQVDDRSFALADCDKPCTIRGEQAQALTQELARGRSATLHIRDYVVQEFAIPIDLEGFRQGLEWLAQMQARFRSETSG